MSGSVHINKQMPDPMQCQKSNKHQHGLSSVSFLIYRVNFLI